MRLAQFQSQWMNGTNGSAIPYAATLYCNLHEHEGIVHLRSFRIPLANFDDAHHFPIIDLVKRRLFPSDMHQQDFL